MVAPGFTRSLSMTTKTRTSRAMLYLGLFGGAAAWALHLFLAQLVAEFGCVASWADRSAWGVTAVAWLTLAISVAMVLLAAAATVVAHRADRHMRDAPASAGKDNDTYLARLGLITSGLFLLVIAFQTLPIFFYLRDC